MKKDPESLREYQMFGFTLLQFMGMLALGGIVVSVALKLIF